MTNLDEKFDSENSDNNVNVKIDFSFVKAKCPVFSTSTVTQSQPWPDDVILFTPYECHQMILPDYANCLAAKTFLKMCKLNYTVEEKANVEFMSPTHTVPFIKFSNSIIANIDEIIKFVRNRNVDLSESLGGKQKSDLNIFMSLVSMLQYIELYVCWIDEEIYQSTTKPKYGFIFPWPLNWIQTTNKRREVYKKLQTDYWNEKTLSEILTEFENCCQAINNRLDGKVQFFEGCDTELDAIIFGHLFAILNTKLPGNYLEDIVRKFPDLVLFVERMRKEYINDEPLDFEDLTI